MTAIMVPALVLLCANEAFGQPPLMTKSGPPPAELVGDWSSGSWMDPKITLKVQADGAVSGTVGDATILSGHYAVNRSWFGKFVNWRTDHIIRGTLSQSVQGSGDRFSAPFNLRDSDLVGSIFLSHPGKPRPYKFILRKS
jgi:hypothetical protein